MDDRNIPYREWNDWQAWRVEHNTHLPKYPKSIPIQNDMEMIRGVLEMGDGERVRSLLAKTSVPEREPRLKQNKYSVFT